MTASAPISHRGVALLSEHTLFREGVVALLRAAGLGEIGEFKSVDMLLSAAQATPPRVLLVDLDHEAHDSLALIRRLRRALPESTLVAIGTALRQAAVASMIGPGLETPSA